MTRVVMDPLPIRIDVDRLLEALRMRPESSKAQAVLELVAEAQKIARPKAIYCLAYIGEKGSDWVDVEGIRFTSRVLRVNLDQAQRVFAYVGTAGRELDEWARSSDDLLTQYYSDKITEAVLYGALVAFGEHLRQRFELVSASEMHPGSLEDWPLREQRPLFALLGETREAIGVELTKACLMTPAKTVSGFIFPTEESFASCQLCAREVCPNRRAAYDPDLYAERYRQTEVTV